MRKKLKDKVYTVSALKNLLSCKNFKNDPRGSKAMERGSIIHSILEVGVDKYDKTGSTYRGQWRPYRHLDEFDLNELEDIATLFKEKHPEFFTDEWEKEATLEATTSKGHKLSGILDSYILNSATATILDWKTGISRADTKNELDMLQAIFYSYILFKTYPHLHNVIFTYVYIDSIDDKVTIRFKSADLENMEALIERYIFASKHTGLKLNSKCKYCANKDTCPLLVDKAIALQDLSIKEIKDLKGALEAYLKEYKEDMLKKALESGELKGFTKVAMYYISTDQLSEAEKLELVKDKIKVTKKKALIYKQRGLEVEEKASYRMR